MGEEEKEEEGEEEEEGEGGEEEGEGEDGGAEKEPEGSVLEPTPKQKKRRSAAMDPLRVASVLASNPVIESYSYDTQHSLWCQVGPAHKYTTTKTRALVS